VGFLPGCNGWSASPSSRASAILVGLTGMALPAWAPACWRERITEGNATRQPRRLTTWICLRRARPMPASRARARGTHYPAVTDTASAPDKLCQCRRLYAALPLPVGWCCARAWWTSPPTCRRPTPR
jgi:hypothetical protein